MLYLSRNVNFKLSGTKSCKPPFGCCIFALRAVKKQGEERGVKSEERRVKNEVPSSRGEVDALRGLFVERLMR